MVFLFKHLLFTVRTQKTKEVDWPKVSDCVFNFR